MTHQGKPPLCFAALSFVLFLTGGCTEEGEPRVHPDSWVDPLADVSHMARIASSGIGGCVACHGDDYLGGTSGVSCYTCHEGGPSGHPSPRIWLLSPDSTSFHGNVARAEGFDHCALCHGARLDGGVAGARRACTVCHSTEQIDEWLGE
ncbi:MAG: hypothetical protein ACE5LH_04870 [Fidelibacterota bacterium]